jgi:hypothetical protein
MISATLFETMVQEKCDALFVLARPIEPEIVLLAAGKKMPAIYQFSAYVDLGGLASYGASLALMGRQTARYTAKIFQGSQTSRAFGRATGRLRTCLEPQDGCRTWIEYSGSGYRSRRQGD